MKFNFVRFFLLFAVIFGLARPVLAGVSYTRTPSGISITSPVNVNFSFDNFSDLFPESPQDNFYRIEIRDISDNEYWADGGEYYASTTKLLITDFDLPVGFQAIYVKVWGYTEVSGSPNDQYNLEYNNDETIFTIISGGGLSVEAPSGGLSNSSPQVKLTTEISGTYRKELPIYYSAADPNSGIGALKSLPITIFYSDDEGYKWQKITENQPNTGVYTFDTTKVPDGTNYKIRVVALDGYNYPGNADSESFSIDNTGPSFDISISPSPAREKDTIALKITSSEELKALPELKITQKDAEPKIVVVSGSGKNFSASYYIERDSGKAVISILGEDLTGNIGDTIFSGGSFLVGFYGPPPPAISFPVNNQIFSEKVINVTGASLPYTKIILTLNGVTKYTIQSSSDGSFKIENLTLSAANKGYNTLSIVAVNEKGEESEEMVLKVKLNSSPKIFSTSIVAGEILSGQKEIVWTSFDSNDDKLVFSIEYSNDGGASWDYIISDFFENSYKIDTLQLADGSNYFLKITADDGTEKASKIFKNVVIKNNLPHISLDIPANYFTNINILELTGKVTGSEQNIASVEYSTDRGEIWRNAIALDNGFDSLVEKFKIPVSEPLKDGKYAILIKATDTSNRSVKISRSFTIDTIPPVVELPSLDKPFATGANADVTGKTEPGTKIELALRDKIYKTIAGEKGDFEVKNVILPFHGSNKISLTASDLAGNVTKIAGNIISNNPPEISVLNVKEGDFLGGVKEITWQVKDLDNDQIVSQIFYRKGEREWIALTNIHKWDVSNLKEADDYQLKLEVTDGITPVAITINISIDNTLPEIEPLLLSQTAFKKAFTLVSKGTASDNFSGIEFIEYSIDGENWFKALITEGYLQKNASFKIQHPFDLKDGEYEFGVRAVDAAGNISQPKFEKIIVDTTPPRIGSYTVSRSSLVLLPEGGSFQVLSGSKIKFTISFEEDTDKAFLTVGEQKINLLKNKAIGLWETEINFQALGKSSMSITAADLLGNSTANKDIGSFNAVSRGKISFIDENGASQPIKDVEINILVWSEENQAFNRWQAENYNENNPAVSFENSEYELALPAGKYQLLVQKTGFMRLRTNDFTLSEPGFINFDFILTKRAGVKGFFEDILEKLNP